MADGTNWVQQTQWSFGAATKAPNNGSPWTAGTTKTDGSGSTWTDTQGCWSIEAGYINAITASNNGTGYTTYTGSISTPNDTNANVKTNPAYTFAGSGGSYTTPTIQQFTNLGRGMSSATASFTGATGSSASMTLTVSGNILQCNTGGATSGYNQFGAQGPLTTTPLNVTQRVVGSVHATASTDQWALIARCTPASPTQYVGYVTPTGYTIWRMSSYVGTSGTATNLGSGSFSGVNVGDSLTIDFRAVGSSPTTLYLKVTNVTTSTVLYDSTTGAGISDSTAGYQTAGAIGVGLCLTRSSYDTLTVYTPQGISISPTVANLNVSSQSLALTGTNTSWSAGTPGTPTFTLTNSGGTNASIVSQTVASATSATLVINTGSVGGSITINDPSTSTSAIVVLQAIIPPNATGLRL